MVTEMKTMLRILLQENEQTGKIWAKDKNNSNINHSTVLWSKKKKKKTKEKIAFNNNYNNMQY